MTPHIEMDYTARRNKVIGIAVSALFHALLLVLFLFMGLKYQIPPPPEYGIEVDMGGGGGGGNSGRTTTTPSVPESPSGDITQNIEETVNTNPVPKVQPTTNPTPTTPRVEPTPTTPTINQQAMYQKRNNSGGTGTGGEGTSTGPGKGNGTGGDGDNGTGHGNGGGNGIGNAGGDFYLNGRPVISKAFPASKNNLDGKVSVEFRADRDGNVVYAKVSGRGTTIHDLQIWEECEKAARRSKFRAKADAEIEEMGTITYRFVIQ